MVVDAARGVLRRAPFVGHDWTRHGADRFIHPPCSLVPSSSVARDVSSSALARPVRRHSRRTSTPHRGRAAVQRSGVRRRSRDTSARFFAVGSLATASSVVAELRRHSSVVERGSAPAVRRFVLPRAVRRLEPVYRVAWHRRRGGREGPLGGRANVAGDDVHTGHATFRRSGVGASATCSV